jgi:hypothetical protein
MATRETEAESSAFLRSLPAGKHGGLFEGLLRLAEGPGRMFHRLFGMLVSGLMIFLAMMHRGCAVRVRCLLVKLSGSLVPIVCHEILRSAHLTVALCGEHVHDEQRTHLSLREGWGTHKFKGERSKARADPSLRPAPVALRRGQQRRGTPLGMTTKGRGR